MRSDGVDMPETTRRRTLLEIPWKTLLKIIAAGALVWVCLQLYQILLLVIVAVLLAVILNPLVRRLERYGWSRGLASSVVSFALFALVIGFFWLTWSSLSSQASLVAGRYRSVAVELIARLPAWMRDSIAPQASDVTSALGVYAVGIASSTTRAIGVAFLGFVLMIYLLIEGRETRDWLVAFTPRTQRAKIERTLDECEQVMVAYAVGNLITSIIATVFTFVVLWWLKVPAALLLALMAGISDFVPVLGFILSAVPAILLALTVSGTTTLLVAAAYVFYNAVEAYLISPWAYGSRMKLSNVAVILAFAVGAEVGGVIGALIALPIAAIYPAIERIWLRQQVGEDTVRTHQAIERRAG